MQQSDIERRIAAVESVGSIVNAMLALARAQLPEADAAAASATAYVDEIDRVIHRLAEAVPFEADQRLTIVLGPERPLCGALPRTVASAAYREPGAVALVGRRFHEAYDLLGGPSPTFVLPGPTSVADIADAARALAGAVLEHASGMEIALLHPIQGAGQLHRTVLLGAWVLRESSPPTFSPVADVLEAAIRESTTSRLRVALAETLRVEVAARVIAAEGARRAAEREEEELKRAWRVARHEQITSEILDLARSRRPR